MAKNNDLNIKLTTSLTSGLKSLKNVNKSLTDMQRNVNKNSGSMNNMQKNITKMNSKLTNLGKDANRASTGFKGLGKSMNTLNSVMNIGKWYLLANAIKNVVNASMDNIEVVNMFSVALGQLTEKAEETVQALSKVYGLDATNIRSAIGNYSTLARSMGMTNVQAEAMATSTYQLALELSSLYNIPINQVLGDLKSGLVGQSETVYKYGLDVTEAGIKAEAMAQGITKSVRSMSQGEKMALRYNVMLQKSGLSHGDFARTIDQPANQLRILQERFTTLSRSIGNMFIPMLTAILPYANALLKVVIEIADRLALLLGFEPLKVKNMDTGFGGVAEDIDDQGDALDSATKKAKAYENQLMGFDQLNILKEPKDTSSSGGDDTGSILGGMDIPRYDVELVGSEKVEGIADRLRETFKKWKEDTYYLTDSLKALGLFGLQPLIEFASGTFGDFYETVLKPFGEWTLSKDGLPKLIYILANDLSKIDYSNLKTSLRGLYETLLPFTSQLGKGLVWIYENALLPLTKLTIETILPTFIDTLATSISWLTEKMEELDITTFIDNMGGLDDILNSDVAKRISDVAIAIGLLFASFKVADALIGIVEFVNLLGGLSSSGGLVQGILAGIQTVLATLTAPIVIVTSVIALLVAGFVNLWRNSEDFRESIKELGIKAVEFLSPLAEFINTVFVDSWNKILKPAILFFIDEMIPDLIGIFENLWVNVLVPLGNFILDVFGPVFEKLGETLLFLWNNVMLPLVGFLGKVFAGAWKILVAVFNEIVLPVVKVLIDIFGTVLKKAMEKIMTFMNENVSPLFDKVFTFLGETATWVGDRFEAFSEVAIKVIGAIGTFLKDIFAKDWGETWDALVENFKTIFDRIKEFAKTPINAVIGFVNSMLSGINDAINNIKSTLNLFKVDLPDAFGGGTLGFNFSMGKALKIPELAKGGVVNDPTLAMVGEAGKEVVMPLENNTGWIRDLAGQISEHGGSGGGMNEDTMYRVMSKAIKDNMGDVILYLDSKEVARANRKGEAKLGRNFNRIQTT